MNLRKHDLNLIPILYALLKHRNVTRAGAEVGLSQSATSHALMRLRDVFKDPLLVSAGREMLLSRKAEELLEVLGASVLSIEQLFEAQEFDPSKSARHFCIATSDYVATLLLPEIIRRLQAEAPNVTVEMVWDVADASARLRAGRLDFAMRPAGTVQGEGIVSECLYRDELVVVGAEGNPLFDAPIETRTLRESRLIVFRRELSAVRGFAESQLIANDISLDDALFVPNFVVIPFIVAETNYLTLLHHRFASKMQKILPLRLAPMPFAVADFSLDAFWSTNTERDAGHHWFRKLLHSVAIAL